MKEILEIVLHSTLYPYEWVAPNFLSQYHPWIILKGHIPNGFILHGCASFSYFLVLNNFFPIEVMTDLYNYVNPKNGKHSPLISKETYDLIMENADVSF